MFLSYELLDTSFFQPLIDSCDIKHCFPMSAYYTQLDVEDMFVWYCLFCWLSVAGVFCAVVSHPADTIVSKLNQQKGSSFMQVGKSLGFLGIKWFLVVFCVSLAFV